MARDSKRATEEMGLDGGGERVGGGGFEHLNWHTTTTRCCPQRSSGVAIKGQPKYLN